MNCTIIATRGYNVKFIDTTIAIWDIFINSFIYHFCLSILYQVTRLQRYVKILQDISKI